MHFSFSPTQQLFILLLLVLGSAFFSAAEISLAASRRIKLQVLADEGDERAKEILALQSRPRPVRHRRADRHQHRGHPGRCRG